MNRLAVVLVLMSCAAHAATTTYYVDKSRPDDSGDGRTADTAKRTIQAAVDLADIGDTVLVAPGIYDEGGAVASGESGFMNRVYLPKGITLKSTQGAAVTHIVGAHDPDYEDVTNWMGCGPKAVRCVLATDTAHGTIIEGFTLRGGATHPTTEKENIDAANGGAFRTATSGQLAALVDCVVSNNVGVRGGAVFRGHCVRTRFTDNLALVKGAIGTYAYFHFCVGSGNVSSAGGLCVGSTSVNCTYVNNRVAILTTEGSKNHNIVALQNGYSADNCNSGNSDKNMLYYHSVIPNANSIGGADESTITNATPVQFFAPYLGDYRPLPDSDLVDRANAAGLDAIALPAGVARDRDIMGQDIDRTQPFHVGAIQTLSPTPASGRAWFSDSTVEIDGRRAEGHANYIYTETYPTQILMRPVLSGTTRVYAWNIAGRYRAPLPDDSLWFLLPVPGNCYTNALRTAPRTVYVDAAASAGGDGTAAAPFNTIQAAIDADSAANASGYHVIQIAAGRYDSDEGLKVLRGCTNRVTVPSGYAVRLLGAGEGKTVIVGAPDPNSPAGDGRGPAAIRCVASAASQAGHCTILQNLTLTDGYCGYGEENGTKDIQEHQGSGFAVQNNSAFTLGQLADCTVTNCWSYRGAVYGATVYRSRIVDCWGGNGGIRYSKLIACLVENMRNTGGNANPLSYNCEAYNTTFIHDDNTLLQLVTVPVKNSVVVGSKQAPNSVDWAGTFVWDIFQDVSATAAATLADPQLTRRTQGDYHPLTSSPVYGGGVWYDNLPMDYSPDREGQPMVFVEGRPSSGAFQKFRAGWSVDLGTPSYGVTTSGPTGYGELVAGETINVALDISAAMRPYLGLTVNGQLQPNATIASLTPTAADIESAAGRLQVSVVFGTNWYVNATSGDDGATGWTPATAKKTFARLFDDGTVLAGDVVHAAAGTYAEGVMFGDSTTWVKNRLVIPSGVCVVGDEGAEKTIIRGADADAPIVDELGRGTNATRCVYMNAKSEIHGFTLTGGRTCGDGSQNAANMGGAVYGNTPLNTKSVGNSARVYDCIISNNASCRGGGAHAATLVNCRLFYNWVKNNRAAASQCHLFNCVVDHNRGTYSLQNCYLVYNCTFGPDARLENGTTVTAAYGLPLGPVVNCLFLATTPQTAVNSEAGTKLSATNCLFIAQPTGAYYTYENCRQSGALAVDADYRPIVGACDAVDAADPTLIPEDLQALATETDATGQQRVYNNALDVGAVEGDWRTRYAKDIRAAGIAVTAASPAVVESTTKKVRLLDGSLETTLTGGASAKVLLSVALKGAGTLTTKLNGAELPPTSVADGVASYGFVNPGVGSTLSFAYTPAADGDYAEIAQLDFRGGLVLIFK